LNQQWTFTTFIEWPSQNFDFRNFIATSLHISVFDPLKLKPHYTDLLEICCRLAGLSVQQISSKSPANLQQVYSLLAICCRLAVDKSVASPASLQQVASKSPASLQQIRLMWFDLYRAEVTATVTDPQKPALCLGNPKR
jgi:hypothetical protein